ncbi:hypothetical protein MYX65_01385, partial [Acidobacteria bacterium AH-259-L09]|nr:hypothetical protein [Acidobacteria bacterium AH-259-L09]
PSRSVTGSRSLFCGRVNVSTPPGASMVSPWDVHGPLTSGRDFLAFEGGQALDCRQEEVPLERTSSGDFR